MATNLAGTSQVQADSAAALATAAQQLVAELVAAAAAAEGPGAKARRERAAAWVLDAWARERKAGTVAMTTERARWRRRLRAAGGAGDAQRTEAVWKLVGDRMGAWQAQDRGAYRMEMHFMGMVVGEEFGAPDCDLPPAADMWARMEAVPDSQRWRERKAEAGPQLKRLAWELADYQLRKWDAEDGVAEGIDGSPASADDDDDGDGKEEEEEEAGEEASGDDDSVEKKRKTTKEEARASAECLARTGLPSSARRRAALRAYLDSASQVGSQESKALLAQYFASSRSVEPGAQAPRITFVTRSFLS